MAATRLSSLSLSREPSLLICCPPSTVTCIHTRLQMRCNTHTRTHARTHTHTHTHTHAHTHTRTHARTHARTRTRARARARTHTRTHARTRAHTHTHTHTHTSARKTRGKTLTLAKPWPSVKVTGVRESKIVWANYLRKFSIDSNGIWYTVETCWCDGPHTHFIQSIHYWRERTLLMWFR